MAIALNPLYTLTGTAAIEKLGKVQDGERIKIEFRGATAPECPIQGRAHGSTWILIGATGPGETSAVQEVITPARERLVLELRGYTISADGEGMEVRTCGIIRSSAARFADIDGHVAVVVQRMGADNTIRIEAFHL